MTLEELLGVGSELSGFLAEFGDCFGRTEPRRKMKVYVGGQVSDLPRKSVEPIALAAKVKPRTLQEFLASDLWDEDRLRQHTARIVVRDHADAQAIGIIDESGHPKKGSETAGVGRQSCGNTGKIDNCVMTVHLVYTSFDGEFRTMLDSELSLPKSWDEDRERCRDAGIPDDVVYRSKYVMALSQRDRAMAAGVRFSWITADEWSTQKPAFVRGLEERGQRFVLEMPRNFALWRHDPGALPETAAKRVDNLCRYSHAMMRQPWQKWHVKDTDKGPMVWEVKFAPCWRPRDDGVAGPYWLIMARNALDPAEVKYFLSNAGAGVPLAIILHVAFGRWPVERVLQDEKSELGLSHFEARGWLAVKRHLLLTQVSHLFLVRQTLRLRGEKPGADTAPDAGGGRRRHRHARPAGGGPDRTPAAGRREDRILADTKRPGPKEPHRNSPKEAHGTRNQPHTTPPLPPYVKTKGALSY